MRSARSVVQLFPHVAISFFYRAGSSPRARVWWPTEGLPNVKGCGPRKRATKVFFSKLRKLKNWILKGTRTKKTKNNFLDGWENITSSRALLWKVTPICCFATFFARADPRGSCTIPSVMGKRFQLISHASLVQITLFFSTFALVNNLFGSRSTVVHSSSLFSQRKSHRNCLRFSLFLSEFPTVFFKTDGWLDDLFSSIKLQTFFFKTNRSIPSNTYLSFSRLRLFIFFIFMWIFFVVELFSIFSISTILLFTDASCQRFHLF